MENRGRTVSALFGEVRSCRTEALWQWDRGQLLQVSGITLPEAWEAHVSNGGKAAAERYIGSGDTLAIDDKFLESGAPVNVWIYLHEAEDDGETEYVITIPVRRRPEPEDAEPSPEQEDIIAQAITALNGAVEQTGADVQAAAASAGAAAGSATAAGQSASAAAGSAQEAGQAAIAAGQAAIAAGRAAEAAGASASQAVQAAELAGAAASAAGDAADAAAGSASQAGASAGAAAGSATSAEQSAGAAAGSATAAGQFASAAAGSATSAEQSAGAAAGSATAAGQSAGAAAGSATAAGQFASAAAGSATSAEQSAGAAAGSATTATEMADLARGYADGKHLDGTTNTQLSENNADYHANRAKDEADRAETLVGDLAKEETLQEIESETEQSVDLLEQILEAGHSSGDLNGYSLAPGSGGEVILSYTDPETEETSSVVMITETTGAAIAEALAEEAEMWKEAVENAG